jgi:ribosomal-protein-serine acetyltransferase
MIEFDLGTGARLRSLRASDAPGMYALIASERAHFDRWLRWSTRLNSPSDSATFLAEFEAQEARGEGFHFGIFEGDTLVGGVICWPIHPRRRSAEIGYWLGTRHLGRGLVTRASALVVDHLLGAMNVHTVEIVCAVGNLSSRAVPERLGFRLEGVRESPWRDGSVVDQVVYTRRVTDRAPVRAQGRLLTAHEFRALLDRLASSWTRRDYPAAAAEFADDVRYADPTRYALNGRPALRAFFEDDEGREQRVAWHNVVFDPAQQVGAAEYTYDGTHRYHGTVLIRLADGLVTHWREYQHVDDRAWKDFAGETRFP